MRPSDVPTYVEAGAADLGITGKDVLLEQRDRAVYELLDLRYGACRMVLAGAPGRRAPGRGRAPPRGDADRHQVPANRRALLRGDGPPGRGDRGQGLRRAGAAGRASPTGSWTWWTRGGRSPRTTSRCARRSPPARRGSSPTGSPTSCAPPRWTAGRPDAGGDRMKIERIDWDGTDAPAFAARLRKLASPQEEVAETVAEIVGSRPRPAATRRSARSRSALARRRRSRWRVDPDAIAAAPGLLEPDVREALRLAAKNIAAVARAELEARDRPATVELPEGQRVEVRAERGGGGRRLRAGGQGGVPVLGLDVLHPGARRGGEPGRGREPGGRRAVAPARRCWRRAQQRASTRCTRSAAPRRSPRSPTARRASTASI